MSRCNKRTLQLTCNLPQLLCGARARFILNGPHGVPHGVLAEPFTQSVEEREGDLHLWQHWAQVDDIRRSMQGASLLGVFVWPRRFRLKAAFVACRSLWSRRQCLKGHLIHDVDVSAMDELASASFFPWAPGAHSINGRLRSPCDLWQQDHAVLLPADAPSGTTLLSVDVLDALQEFRFKPVSLQLPAEAHRRGVHGLVTWAEVEEPLGRKSARIEGYEQHHRWWSWADLRALEDKRVVCQPSLCKQGLLLAQHPLPGQQDLEMGVAHPLGKRATHVEVSCWFRPAKGELRFTAKWNSRVAF